MARLSDNDEDAYKWAEDEARKLAVDKQRKALEEEHFRKWDDAEEARRIAASAKITASPDEGDIIRLLASHIDWNEDREKLKKAKYIVNVKTKPDPDKRVSQQLCLPLQDPRDYDDELRLRNGTGQLELLPLCGPDFLTADAQRARTHAQRATASAEFKTVRSERFMTWIVESLTEKPDRSREELIFKTFVEESGFLKAKPSGEPPKPEPSLDDNDDD
jgi:hypothetical protein